MVAHPLFRKIFLTLSTSSFGGLLTRDIISIMSPSMWMEKEKVVKKSHGRSELSASSPPAHSSDIHGTNTIADEGISLNTDHSGMILIGSFPVPLGSGNERNSQSPSPAGGLVSFSVGTETNQSDFAENNVRSDSETFRRRPKRIRVPNKDVISDSLSKINLSNGNFKAGEITGKIDGFATLPAFKPFDICPNFPRNFGYTRAVPSVAGNPSHEIVLRSGMALLKHFISHKEQVQMVKTIRKLGLGPGGFYQPFYRGGARLRLQMMCLGRNWDPETKYTIKRSFDGCEPLYISKNFTLLVLRAIERAHICIQKDHKLGYAHILPHMVPDICIVNFYATHGKLGLHQDKDESRESLDKGLPVVSFSIGDSAEFLFGDQRDLEKAEGVLLESGDVLIFGGESRHVFHGVSSIISNSAPKALLEDTGLRPGRLNLTFRQY